MSKEVPTEKHEWRTSLEQEDPELWSVQETQQLQSLEEDNTNMFPFTAVPVKSEDDAEKAQPSQFHQRQSEQMETRADEEGCGGSEPARILGPASDLQQEYHEEAYSSDHNTENSDDYSQGMSQPQTGLISLNYNEDIVSHEGCNSVDKLCGGKTVNHRKNMAVDKGGKPFSCSLCGKGFGEKSDLKRHL